MYFKFEGKTKTFQEKKTNLRELQYNIKIKGDNRVLRFTTIWLSAHILMRTQLQILKQ